MRPPIEHEAAAVEGHCGHGGVSPGAGGAPVAAADVDADTKRHPHESGVLSVEPER